jgi:hypothetical protein
MEERVRRTTTSSSRKRVLVQGREIIGLGRRVLAAAADQGADQGVRLSGIAARRRPSCLTAEFNPQATSRACIAASETMMS